MFNVIKTAVIDFRCTALRVCVVFFFFGPQKNRILFPTHPLWSDISEEMTSLCLSRGARWEKEQRPVYEKRVSHGEDIRVSHPV